MAEQACGRAVTLREGTVIEKASGVVILAVVTLTLFAGPAVFAVAVVVCALAAAADLYRIERARGMRPIPLAGFVAVAAFGAIAFAGRDRAPQTFAAAVTGAFVFAAATLVAQRRIEGATERLAQSMVGVVLIGLLGSYVIVLRRMPFGFRVALAFVVLVAVQASVAAIYPALRPGRRRAAERARAEAGAAGLERALGLVVAALATVLAAAVLAATLDPPFDRARALVLGVVVAVAAPLGSHVGGMVEQEKTGPPARFPVLRRIDAALVSAPLFFYAYRTLSG